MIYEVADKMIAHKVFLMVGGNQKCKPNLPIRGVCTVNRATDLETQNLPYSGVRIVSRKTDLEAYNLTHLGVRFVNGATDLEALNLTYSNVRFVARQPKNAPSYSS